MFWQASHSNRMHFLDHFRCFSTSNLDCHGTKYLNVWSPNYSRRNEWVNLMACSILLYHGSYPMVHWIFSICFHSTYGWKAFIWPSNSIFARFNEIRSCVLWEWTSWENPIWYFFELPATDRRRGRKSVSTIFQRRLGCFCLVLCDVHKLFVHSALPTLPAYHYIFVRLFYEKNG